MPQPPLQQGTGGKNKSPSLIQDTVNTKVLVLSVSILTVLGTVFQRSQVELSPHQVLAQLSGGQFTLLHKTGNKIELTKAAPGLCYFNTMSKPISCYFTGNSLLFLFML